MSFSREWETAHADGRVCRDAVGQLCYMLEIFVPGPQERVLELGCGAGPNVDYWLRRPANYYGLEGSETAIAECKRRYPYIAKQFACCDFSQTQPFGFEFDVIFDRASVSHNSYEAMQRCIGMALEYLKPGGIYIGVDWFSSNHSEIKRGEEIDRYTRTGYKDGQFRDVGAVHFSSESELGELFAGFEGVFLQERVTRSPYPDGGFMKQVNRFRWQSKAFDDGEYASAVWDLVARKPE